MKLLKSYIQLFIFLSIVYSCKSQNNEINWDRVGIQKEQYFFNFEDNKPLIDSIFKNNHFLNVLLKDSIVINSVFFEINNYKTDGIGSYLKRFPDTKNSNKIITFLYEIDYNDFGKMQVVEIQTRDVVNSLIDSEIISIKTKGEDCSMESNFAYSNYLIKITENNGCIFTNKNREKFDTKSKTKYFSIKPNGKIVNYYDQPDGEIKEKSDQTYALLKDAVDDDGIEYKEVTGHEYYYNTGTIKNHLKHGGWEEYGVYEQALDYYEDGKFVKATGIYKEGEKDGKWTYYILNRQHSDQFIDYESVNYKEGVVVK